MSERDRVACLVRMPRGLREQVRSLARIDGCSMNAWMVNAIEAAVVEMERELEDELEFKAVAARRA